MGIMPMAGLNTNVDTRIKASVSPVTSWSALGNGLTGGGGTCYSISTVGSNTLYAGGSFTNAGGVNASNVAKWESNAWSALGEGLNGQCWAIAVASNGHVFCGGDFSDTGLGSIALANIGEWDGSTWSPLGTGLNGICYALTIIGTDLYAVGDFTSAGGVAGTSRVAKWDGTTWSALGTGMSATCRSITNDGTNIYVGGDFAAASGGFDHIAKYNGTTWSSLGSGLTGGANVICRDILISGGFLYATGRFTMAGGTSVDNIAAYDLTGGTWSALGVGLSGGFGRSLTLFNGKLFVGGDFGNKIKKWNIASSIWSGLGNGIDGGTSKCRVVEVDTDGNVFAGGEFTAVNNGTSANRIAKWSGDALPIELGYFYANQTDKSIKLNWETYFEFNNKGFDVQKSANQVDWLSIGWVDGKDVSYQKNTYNFVDESPFDNENYYRLKQIDFDGKFDLSKVINVQFENLNAVFSLYPNPAKSHLKINISSESILLNVKIYGINGQLVSTVEIDNNTIDISKLEVGTYIVKAEINGRNVAEVFVVE